MKINDVIVIGAGAAGLMAAYTLTKAGKTVKILEARHRAGGRIHTITAFGFTHLVELGAEFVHGNLPVTLGLLKEANINTTNVGFEMWQYHNNTFEQSAEFIEGFGKFLAKLNQLEQDMPMQEFIQLNFSGNEYAKMRIQLENYVAGYDTADIADASAFALRNEWNHEDEDAQHRVTGGYSTMIDYLATVCNNANNEITFNTVVQKIEWGINGVIVKDVNGNCYEAKQLIVALPLGVLKLKETDGGVVFKPELHALETAIDTMGFGSVIKILLEFDESFWLDNMLTGKKTDNMGFLFADEQPVPTFWTQSPQKSSLLTGWLGGPPAHKLKDATDNDILEMALASLEAIYKMDTDVLKNRLLAWHVANWTAEPYTRGSYAYDTVDSAAARKVVQQPVDNIIFFTGEYLYNGPAMGTVEAALTSGRDVAQLLLKTLP